MKNIVKIMALMTLVASVLPAYAGEQNCEKTVCVTSEAQIDLSNIAQKVDEEKANIPAAWFYSWLVASSTLVSGLGLLSSVSAVSLVIDGSIPVFKGLCVAAALLPASVVPIALAMGACKAFCNKKTFEKMADITDDIGSMFGLIGGTVFTGLAGYQMYSYIK